MPNNPELSENDRKLLNRLFWLVKYAQWDKDELQELLYPEAKKGSKERTIRKLFELLCEKGYAVIATSDDKGYRLGFYAEDKADNIHQWKETDSRIEKLEQRRKANIALDEKIKRGESEHRPSYWGNKEWLKSKYREIFRDG
ncbi:MAG: hypothetical protein EOM59_11725 [Clostridia bacterium]|nr:hypothetical protein [Clostridia bacterium]